MPPKKKQEQIDLSTLPQLKSINIFLLCKGKQERAKKILNKIDTKFNKNIFHVTKTQILDFAKQKSIYIDPTTLTQKQKKDNKFMDSICTQLTPQVLAKATGAYLTKQVIKLRIQKKAQLSKLPPQQAKTENKNKIDCIYIFDDFPTQTADFQALDAINQGIKFIFVIQPTISWTSAPQQPQPIEEGEQVDNEYQQAIDQYNKYKKIKENQNLTPQEQTREKTIQDKIQNLKNARRKSATTSQFRNTVIDYIKCTIDPYNEQINIDDAANLLIPRCQQLNQQKTQFDLWKKDKQALKLPQKQQKLQQKKQQIQQKTKISQQADDNIIKTLTKLLSNFSSNNNTQNQEKQQINFDNYNFSQPQIIQNKQLEQTPIKKSTKSSPTFLQFNQKSNKQQRNFIEQILTNMRYPGVNRFMMPNIPSKSQKLRKLYRATFGQFLPNTMSFQQFQRKVNILFLQSMAKQSDNDRSYDFSNRIYQQQHTKQSLLRELNKALLFDQSSLLIKYNQNNDKLYLCLLYRNPARRMTKKIWQSNWKILPNFEAWLRYFKDNQNNINNTQYYDIDYQKIGNIEEQCNIYTIKDSGVIIRKNCKIAGYQNYMLYCLPGFNTGDLIFGLRKKGKMCQFYAKNQIVSITVTSIKQQIQKQQKQEQIPTSTSIFLTFKNQSVIQFKQNGDMIIRKPNTPPRLIKRDSYTIIYHPNNKTEIFHPNGGISYPPSRYVNENGLGLNNNILYEVPTLKRMNEQGNMITRRDDATVIVQTKNSKWIKFPDQTQYLHQNGEIVIEKQDYPRFTFKSDQSIVINYNGVQITTSKKEDTFQYLINFTRIQSSNTSSIKLTKSQIQIHDGKTQTPYICKLLEQQINKSWDNQTITVNFNKSTYKYNQKILDPEQDQDNFNQNDIIKNDYLIPRLFIINNDNTGIQLLTDQQLDKCYFYHFSNNKQIPINSLHLQRPQLRVVPHQQFPKKQFIYGVIPIPQTSQLNKNTIKQIPINLDIFNNLSSINNQHQKQIIYQIRQFIKYQPVKQQDRITIAEIQKKRNQWQIKYDKQQNQFGYRQKNNQITLDKCQSKKNVIDFRKFQQQHIFCQFMKNQAINLYNQQTQNMIKVIQNERLQAQQQKILSKKKSYISKYKWKQPPPIQVDENKNYYNYETRFYKNYFQTLQGKKALTQMPQWIFRPKQQKRHHELDPQIREQLNATLNKTTKQQSQQNRSKPQQSLRSQSQKHDKINAMQLSPTYNNNKNQIKIKPSIFTQRQIDQQRYAFLIQKNAYQYHQKKRKDFNIYGTQRTDKIQVPTLLRTQPISQLNQKYLVIQAPVDNKIKISSMKNKLTSSASNMTEMRKQGPHVNLIRTIDKANDYNKLLQKRTMMIQADLNDQLQRDILITPIQANFGMIEEGSNYQLKISVKNEDVLAQRIKLKKPSSIFCKVQMLQMGPIALGIIRKIKVILKANNSIIGKFCDQFSIVSKHEIYHIPIIAQILSKTQYQSSESVLLKSVRRFEQVNKKKREELPPIN